VISPRHRIVVIEGLYTFLSIDPWRKAAELLDERWLLEVDVEEAERRLVKRHVVSGITADWEAGVRRARENDMPSEWCKVCCFPQFTIISA
jgi:pantothenate kinase